MISANAITSDKKGNVYIDDRANNRILKINVLLGVLLPYLQLKETNEERIHHLFWSNTEPNLTVVHGHDGDRISSYNVPKFD